MKGCVFMKKNNIIRKYIFLLIIPFSILLTIIASNNSSLTEKIYSSSSYKVISQIISNITGLLPFSLAEILFIFILVFVPYWLLKTLIQIIRSKSKKIKHIKRAIFKIVKAISIIYFSFIIMWGLNYHRLPLANITNLKIEDSSVDDLIGLSEHLVNRNNVLRKLVHEDNNEVMDLPEGYGDVFNRAYLGYSNASKLYPALQGKYGKPKGVIFSEAMSYMGISGIYSPFTLEANVNVSIPDSMIPVTTCHEMAHQYGFAREDEANFIAYITCNAHPNYDFKYSGNLLAMIYSMNALYEADTDTYRELYNMLDSDVRRDMSYISQYWKKYEGPIEETSSKINDSYLKANQQEDGVKSYGRMVDLLLAEYKLKKSINE